MKRNQGVRAMVKRRAKHRPHLCRGQSPVTAGSHTSVAAETRELCELMMIDSGASVHVVSMAKRTVFDKRKRQGHC